MIIGSKQIPYALLYLPLDKTKIGTEEEKEKKESGKKVSGLRQAVEHPKDYPMERFRHEPQTYSLAGSQKPPNGMNPLANFENSIGGFSKSEQFSHLVMRRNFTTERPRQNFNSLNVTPSRISKASYRGNPNTILQKGKLSSQNIQNTAEINREEENMYSSDVKKLNIQIQGNKIVIKYFSRDSLVAQIVRSLLKHELVGVESEEIDNFGLFLDGEKLNLIDKIGEVRLDDDDVLIFDRMDGVHKENEEMASLDLLPKLTKVGYECKPSLHSIYRMREKELKAVEGLCVWNEWGEVKFLESVDLRRVDLDQLIDIERRSITVYPDDRLKPEAGRGLNVHIQLTFYRFGLSSSRGMKGDEMNYRVQGWVEKMGGRLVDLNVEKDLVVVVVAPRS